MTRQELDDLILWLRDRAKIESVIHGRSEEGSALGSAADLIEAIREQCIGVVTMAFSGAHMTFAADESHELVRLLGITRQECRDYLGYEEGENDMFIQAEWEDE